MRELLTVALILACPLMMVFMMHGSYGHGGHRRAQRQSDNEPLSTEELRQLRNRLDRQIAEREASPAEAPVEPELEPTGWGR